MNFKCMTWRTHLKHNTQPGARCAKIYIPLTTDLFSFRTKGFLNRTEGVQIAVRGLLCKIGYMASTTVACVLSRRVAEQLLPDGRNIRSLSFT
jgi:hypothetical protein